MFHKEIQGDREGELNSLSEFTERVPSNVFFLIGKLMFLYFHLYALDSLALSFGYFV